jgi:hypothetical protein
MHIGDFSCRRGSVFIFCEKHLEQMRKRYAALAKRRKNVRYCVLSYKGEDFDDDVHGVMGIIVTDPAGHGIHPNIFGDHTVIEGETI